jgi:hypothetical protein
MKCLTEEPRTSGCARNAETAAYVVLFEAVSTTVQMSSCLLQDGAGFTHTMRQRVVMRFLVGACLQREAIIL